MKITEIPAKPKEQDILRVAAYTRVSAEMEMKLHSLQAQENYYREYIAAHPGWELAGIYSDYGISGTTVQRPAFQRMLEDCRAGKVDLIVTKSITRFARNTVDLLRVTRELKDLEIDCYFEKENMHSNSPDGEFLLTLLAMYAEEEARSTSENQKWRIQRKFEAGEPWVGKMLGYRMGDGRLEVVPEEAEVVKKIFSDYLAGKSIFRIAKELTHSELPAARSAVWNQSTVARILMNEKYTGNMILQKTFRQDFRTKKPVINCGERRKYEVCNSHEAIISVADFNLVQEKLAKNRGQKAPAKGRPSYIFTKLLRCGQCGSAYVRRSSNSGKYKHYVWNCRRFEDFGKTVCPAQSIPEAILVEKTKEVLGIDEINNEILKNHLEAIIVPGPYRLIYRLPDGDEIEIEWQHKSRRDSWTPEMRQRAREKAIAQHKNRSK